MDLEQNIYLSIWTNKYTCFWNNTIIWLPWGLMPITKCPTAWIQSKIVWNFPRYRFAFRIASIYPMWYSKCWDNFWCFFIPHLIGNNCHISFVMNVLTSFSLLIFGFKFTIDVIGGTLWSLRRFCISMNLLHKMTFTGFLSLLVPCLKYGTGPWQIQKKSIVASFHMMWRYYG